MNLSEQKRVFIDRSLGKSMKIQKGLYCYQE